MTDTLAEYVDQVSMDSLYETYGSLVDIPALMLGVVPNELIYMELWPAFSRTHSLFIPNLLNVPFTLPWNVGPVDAPTIGLCMLACSTSSGCRYCTTHCVTFALMRGAGESDVRAVVGGQHVNPSQNAAIQAAFALGRFPATLTKAHVEELQKHFTPDQEEAILLAVSLMGFLNKTQNALGAPLEEPIKQRARFFFGTGWDFGIHEAKNESTAVPGAMSTSVDNFLTKIKIVTYLPNAIYLETKWTSGTPSTEPASFLKQHTGCEWPVLARVKSGRAVKAITYSLKEAFDEAQSVAGVKTKIVAGIVFASIGDNNQLVEELVECARKFGVSQSDIERAKRQEEDKSNALAVLAKAASFSPAKIDQSVIQQLQGVKHAAIVEMVCFLAVLGCVHRLEVFFKVRGD